MGTLHSFRGHRIISTLEPTIHHQTKRRFHTLLCFTRHARLILPLNIPVKAEASELRKPQTMEIYRNAQLCVDPLQNNEFTELCILPFRYL